MLCINELDAVAGAFRLKEINLSLPSGAYGVLLGPTGSGKTVLIETICGARSVSAGQILIGEEDVTEYPPRDRGIGYVPQDYVLFPTKTVGANISFGLRARGVSRKDAEDRILPILELLGIRHLHHRWPATLSGGEQQRVALARALAIRPRVLLLDEPVSALDEATRDSVCMELKRVQRETGMTTLHICHNLEESRIVADHLSVMCGGRIAQSGTPEQVFTQPRTAELAHFLRVGSVFSGTASLSAEGTRIQIGRTELYAEEVGIGPVTIVVRADEVRIGREVPTKGQPNAFAVEVKAVWPRGLFSCVEVEISPGMKLTSYLPRMEGCPSPGTSVWVSFAPSAVHLLEG